MVSLSSFFRVILIFGLLIGLSSCAKMSYLWEQGTGQLGLLWDGRPNSEVLADPKISDEVKNKIRLIEMYKDYFYKYWDKKETGIYSETTILDGEAVTYLVIASPYDRIRPLEHSFPFMGTFPYLGFFSRESAQKYAQKLEEDKSEKWVTYTRPVYAYSTLGYFEDNILSSFFHYDDYALAELVFHELFHTIFFVKSEVPLNESLATYFSREMTYEYFGLSGKEIGEKLRKEKTKDRTMRKIVDHIHALDKVYQEKTPKTKQEAHSILEDYVSNQMKPDFEKFCEEEHLEKCTPIKRKWNNASFAAIMTYQNKEKKLDQLHQMVGGDLKSFYHYIEEKYEIFLDEDPDYTFSDGLFSDKLEK